MHERHLDFLCCYKPNISRHNPSHPPKSGGFYSSVCHHNDALKHNTYSHHHSKASMSTTICEECHFQTGFCLQGHFCVRIPLTTLCAWKKREGGQETKHKRTNGELFAEAKGHKSPMNKSVPRKRSSLWSLNSHSTEHLWAYLGSTLTFFPQGWLFTNQEQLETVFGQRHWSEQVLSSGITRVLGRNYEPLH